MRNLIGKMYVTESGELGIKPGLGEYLYGLRKCQSKMSLERMASKVGCSKSYLWDVENNRSEPSLSMAAKIAKAYHTSVGRMVKYM